MATGRRLVPRRGMMDQCLAWRLRDLPLGQTIYWSVQAVDSANLGGSFAAEQSLEIPGVVLRIASVSVENGMLFLVGEGEEGRWYELESSTLSADWTGLGAKQADSEGAVRFTRPISEPHQFFRLVMRSSADE